MKEIPMSYGHIDLDISREHTKEMARDISPNNPWDWGTALSAWKKKE